MKFFEFDKLRTAPLIVDAVYEGGWEARNLADEPLSKLFADVGAGLGNTGGFRPSGRDGNGYCVLFSTGQVADWPDTLDIRTGKFIYFGDNRTPGRLVSEPLGNKILERAFSSLHRSDAPRADIPPFLVFEKFPTERSNRSVKFRGLVVPGFDGLSSSEDLVAVLRSKGGDRFQNYRATFSVLDINEVPREWLSDPRDRAEQAPSAWTRWVRSGEYRRLQSTPNLDIRTTAEQIPSDPIDQRMLLEIYKHFVDRWTAFEPFAAYVFRLMYPAAIIDEITQPTADGGRDAVGRLPLGSSLDPIYLDFALEAKCYSPALDGNKGNSVGVRETQRLISRLKYRQFGVLVTTSFVAQQAYAEIREDGHPVIILSGVDIIATLKSSGCPDLGALRTLLTNY